MRDAQKLDIHVMGGLGNQLFGLAAGLVIAGKFGKSPSVNFNRVRYGSNMNRLPDLQNILYQETFSPIEFQPISGNNLHHTYEKFRRATRFVLPNLVGEEEVDYFDSDESVDDQLDQITPGIRSICGPFMDFEWAKQAIKFGFPIELEPKVASESYQNFSSRLMETDIALHIRLGDYLSLPKIFPITSENYYLEGLNLVGINNETRIHVFTDSPEMAKKHLPRIFKNYMAEVIDLENKMSVVETMSVMSKYRTILTSNSTFSSWAAWFGGKKTVITPTPHHKNGWLDKLPEKWIRLPIA